MWKLFAVSITGLCLSYATQSAVALATQEVFNSTESDCRCNLGETEIGLSDRIYDGAYRRPSLHEYPLQHLAAAPTAPLTILEHQGSRGAKEQRSKGAGEQRSSISGRGTRESPMERLSPSQESPVPNPQLAQNPTTPGTNPPPNLNFPIPPNPQPNPNLDRFLQPAPVPVPTTPEQQAPILEPPTPTPTPPSPPVRLMVRKIVVTGNTILTSEINAIAKPVEGRSVTVEELGKVADAITQLYVERGYITSRAVVPDQPVTDGVVQILIIEGSLERIQIEGTRRLNSSYVRSRVQLGASKPLNSAKLEDQLRLLRFNPLFENVEASLRPGTGQGQSILVVRVTEANPFRGSYFTVDNYSSPSVGSERLGANLLYRNISGFGDTIFASYYHSTTGGSDIFDLYYTLPVNAMDGTLQLRAAPNYYEITEPEFKSLDIRGESELYEVSFRQPLIRSPRQEFALSIGFTYRNSQTFFGGDPYPFGFGPDEEGRTRTRVISFGQEYVSRDSQGSTALRSLFSFGIDAFDATINSGSVPDGRFFSWLGQIQRVQRFSNNNLLILQGVVQLTPNSLLPSQQFVIGGGQSVRGYRQNVRSGDNGFQFSVEDRIVLVRNQAGRETLQLAPFVDLGTVWNKSDNPNKLPSQRFIGGVGMGVLWEPIPRLNLRLDYGLPLFKLRDRGENAQDRGFYFQVIYQL